MVAILKVFGAALVVLGASFALAMSQGNLSVSGRLLAFCMFGGQFVALIALVQSIRWRVGWWSLMVGYVLMTLGLILAGYSVFPVFDSEPWHTLLGPVMETADSVPNIGGAGGRLLSGFVGFLAGVLFLVASVLESDRERARAEKNKAALAGESSFQWSLSEKQATPSTDDEPSLRTTGRGRKGAAFTAGAFSGTGASRHPEFAARPRQTPDTEQVEPSMEDNTYKPVYITRVIRVGGWGQERLPLDGLKAGWVLEGELTVEGGEGNDIGFRVDDPGNHVMADLGRIPGHQTFRFLIPENGSYSLLLDNRIAFLSARRVHLSCAAHSPADGYYWGNEQAPPAKGR